MTRGQRIFAYGFGGTIALSALTFVAVAIVMALGVTGCGTDKSVAPLAPSSSVVSNSLVSSVVTTNEAGQQVLTETWRQGGKLVKVIYVCDYPKGYFGPPAPGHCYTDGTGCTGYPGGPPPPAARAIGDPTADD